ncbi:hypothetical protein C8R44DRAFT_888114 [Mycena epipterygia]|nr:hypothetical protein C8R44DRAFT_888114 [Mycena epipterygia]
MHLPSPPLRFRRTWDVGQTSHRPFLHGAPAPLFPLRASSLFLDSLPFMSSPRAHPLPPFLASSDTLPHVPSPSPSPPFLTLHSSAPHLIRVLSCFLRSPPMDILLPIRVPSFFILHATGADPEIGHRDRGGDVFQGKLDLGSLDSPISSYWAYRAELQTFNAVLWDLILDAIKIARSLWMPPSRARLAFEYLESGCNGMQIYLYCVDQGLHYDTNLLIFGFAGLYSVPHNHHGQMLFACGFERISAFFWVRRCMH